MGLRVCFRIGNSFGKKKFAFNFLNNIFVVFIKYGKLRDRNGVEKVHEGTSPRGGAGPPLAAPPYGEGASEPFSDPVSLPYLPFVVKVFAI